MALTVVVMAGIAAARDGAPGVLLPLALALVAVAGALVAVAAGLTQQAEAD